MLRIFLAGFLLLLATNSVTAQEVVIDPTQNPSAPYRLFKTSNIYTFLKLDTSTGKVWQVQWSTGENRFTVPLNTNVLVAGGKAGRFTLYPTTNIYNFILLDQETGNTWQVQWGINEESRMIIPIK
jgi:WD40 repeat protein